MIWFGSINIGFKSKIEWFELIYVVARKKSSVRDGNFY